MPTPICLFKPFSCKACPGIAYDVGDFQQRLNTATTAEIVRASSVLETSTKTVKDNITLMSPPLDFDKVVFVTMTDESFAGQPNGKPYLGYATLMADRRIFDSSARANLLGLGPKKIHRVVNSTSPIYTAAMILDSISRSSLAQSTRRSTQVNL